MKNIMRLIFVCRIRHVAFWSAFWSFVYDSLFVWVLMPPVGDSFGDIRSTRGIGCRPADGQRWSSISAVGSITWVFMHYSFDSHRVFS